MQKTLVVSLVLFGLVLAGGPQVAAQSDRALEAREAAQSRQEVRSVVDERENENRDRAAENRDRAAEKLNENKQKNCEKRETNIKRIMTKMQTRGENQLAVFDKIADRTIAFYEEKQYNVANYDNLTAAVDDKRQLAEGAILGGTASIEDFSCVSGDPVALKDAYKAQLMAQIDALKAYKTAVKDLIVGVKSAQSTNESDSTPPLDEGGQQ